LPLPFGCISGLLLLVLTRRPVDEPFRLCFVLFVFLLSVEDQAIDRVHRIGQKNTVTIYRYCIKDTVEDRILELQDKKRMLSEGALGKEGMHTLGRKRLGMQELMSLFRDVADHVRQAERTARAANAQSWNAQPADAQVDSPGLATHLM
jgi:hypothetical protein